MRSRAASLSPAPRCNGCATGSARSRAAAETGDLAARADPRQRVYFVPAFAGLGAPYWAPGARGALSGLTAECGLPEIARATLEAVGLSDARPGRGDGGRLRSGDRQRCASMAAWRRATGRCSSSPTSCRRRSSGRTRWRRPPGARPMSPGCRAGCVRRRGEMMARWSAERRFAPAMAAAEREERYAGWRRAVAGVLAAASR